MKVKWYRSVRLQLIVFLILIYVGSIALMMALSYQSWVSRWMDQKIDEIVRYGNYIAMNELIDSDLSDNQGGSGEALNFNRFYSYVRILILNENAVVIEDSSGTKIGSAFINQDVLDAMGGTSVRQQRGSYIQLAIPITSYSGADVRGVVYIIFDENDLKTNPAIDTSFILSMGFITIVMVTVLTVFICLVKTQKFSRLRAWLGTLVHNEHVEPDEKLLAPDEYGAIVSGVQDAMHEMIVLDQSRKEFVSNVSHELKTPLSSIKVLAESLLLQEEVPVEMYREFLEDINHEVDRESGIVNDLLTLVRLEEKESALNISHVSLNDLVEDILKRLKPLAEKKGIDLLMESSREVEADVDTTKLTIALSNLIENGIKYNKPNGEVRVRIDSDHLNAKILIEDTGIGIAEENYSKIFQRFYRVDKSRTRESDVGGNGLGLSIVRQIILLHRGTIGVKSILGEGTTFAVSIPLRQVAEQEEEEL